MMKPKTTDTMEKRLHISLTLYKECQKRMISDSTMQTINDIVEDNTTVERARRYQTISRITDILRESKTEEEFLQKLKTYFFEPLCGVR